MKTGRTLLALLLAWSFFFAASTTLANYYSFEWQNANHTLFSHYSNNPINYCGSGMKVEFKVIYALAGLWQVGNTELSACPWGLGANPYRFTIRLFRDNQLLESHNIQSSNCWFQDFFYNIDAISGNFKVEIKLERRLFFWVWSTIETMETSNISCNSSPAVPDFTINNIAIPANDSPINVNIFYPIILNASGCNCETRYFVSVEESDLYWNRTNQYEWGKWFNGEAPGNLNLQQLSTTYSYPPYYTGDPLRQGSPLIGGILPNGGKRYYRIKVCTDEPTWTCRQALISVSY